jgi:hypothetical protein
MTEIRSAPRSSGKDFAHQVFRLELPEQNQRLPDTGYEGVEHAPAIATTQHGFRVA